MAEPTDEIRIEIEYLREDLSGLSLEALKNRVQESYGSALLLELDASLPYPEGATRAAFSNWRRAMNDREALMHALRGEHLTGAEALALAKEDRARFDALIQEDERREALARKKRHDDEQEAA